MRFLGVLLFLALTYTAPIAPAGSVSAQSAEQQLEVKTYNNQLKVTGVVLPAQHIIVDENGLITEILSNTKKDVEPTVYFNNLSRNKIINMTPEIYEQYRQLVPEGSNKVGVLYKRIPGVHTSIPPTPIVQPKAQLEVFNADDYDFDLNVN